MTQRGPETLGRLLDKVKARPDCPSCGANEWMTGAHGGDHAALAGVMLADADGKFSVPGPIHVVLVAVCQRCGFIRMHSDALLRAAAGDSQ